MITLEQAVGVVGAVAEEDEQLLQEMIDRATATLGRMLGIYLGVPEERVEILRVPPYPASGRLLLSQDLTVDTDVSVRSRNTFFEDFVAVETPDTAGQVVYVVDGRSVYHSSGWPVGRGTVEVTYTAGYDPGTGPKHFEEIILQMVAERWASLSAIAIDTAGVDGPYKSRALADHHWTKWTAAELAASAASLGIDWSSFVDHWRRRLP